MVPSLPKVKVAGGTPPDSTHTKLKVTLPAPPVWVNCSLIISPWTKVFWEGLLMVMVGQISLSVIAAVTLVIAMPL